MHPHSLKILEYEQFKNLLAERAVSSSGQKAIVELQPLTDLELIQRRLGETSEYRYLLEKEGQFPLTGLRDISGALYRAKAEGSVLDIQPLIDIADVCRGSRVARNFIKKHAEKTPYLDRLSQELFTFSALEEAIENAIDPSSGEILDRASAELSRIRKSLNQKRDHIQHKLNSILMQISESGRTDAYITLREGRYVIPVRQEERNKVKGVVHDQSTSGVTAFVEPLATVQLNNDIRALIQDEKREITRILQSLTNRVREHLNNLTISYQTLVYLDITGAKAKLSLDFDCIRPEIGVDQPLHIKQGRHILLADIFSKQENRAKTVANSILFPEDIYSILITGPNTGGKTVLLKTVGLIVLMAQTGAHIPADEGTTLPLFDEIFADIGDEQSLEQSLSTFSAHMNHIIHFMNNADRESLVLLDELGAGTDLEEGAALSIAILKHLTSRKATTLATTHYGVLKLFAHEHPNIQNGSMEFNRETLEPTYRFHQNIPGSSYALEIARRLGMPTSILEDAHHNRQAEEYDISEMINDLETEHRRLAEEREALQRQTQQQKHYSRKYQEKLEDLKIAKQEAREKALKEAAEIVRNARKTIKKAIRDIKREQASQEATKAAQQVLDDLQKTIQVEQKKTAPEPEEPVKALSEVEIGQTVRLIDWNTVGTVVEIKDNDNITVARDALKITVPLNKLAAVKEKQTPKPQQSASVYVLDSDNLRSEIDVRGCTAEEALAQVQKYIDEAYLGSLERIRIIHGKGTGVLRKRIAEYLGQHPWVSEHHLASWNEGSSGATIVKLKLK